MKCHHLSTLAETFVEKVVALEQDFTSLSGFLRWRGCSRTGPNNHEVAAQAGYNVVTTQAGAAALTAGAGKTLIIAENLADLTKVK